MRRAPEAKADPIGYAGDIAICVHALPGPYPWKRLLSPGVQRSALDIFGGSHAVSYAMPTDVPPTDKSSLRSEKGLPIGFTATAAGGGEGLRRGGDGGCESGGKAAKEAGGCACGHAMRGVLPGKAQTSVRQTLFAGVAKMANDATPAVLQATDCVITTSVLSNDRLA